MCAYCFAREEERRGEGACGNVRGLWLRWRGTRQGWKWRRQITFDLVFLSRSCVFVVSPKSKGWENCQILTQSQKRGYERKHFRALDCREEEEGGKRKAFIPIPVQIYPTPQPPRKKTQSFFCAGKRSVVAVAICSYCCVDLSMKKRPPRALNPLPVTHLRGSFWSLARVPLFIALSNWRKYGTLLHPKRYPPCLTSSCVQHQDFWQSYSDITLFPFFMGTNFFIHRIRGKLLSFLLTQMRDKFDNNITILASCAWDPHSALCFTGSCKILLENTWSLPKPLAKSFASQKTNLRDWNKTFLPAAKPSVLELW